MMRAAKPTPWDGLLKAALRLGLTPEAFWRLSLREWQALNQTSNRTGFGKADLMGLLSAFPDQET